MVRKLVLTLIAAFGACALAAGQQRQISGTVTSADGTPIAGATVMVDGTLNGATTEANGQFSVTAPADGTLSVSFIGYETKSVAIAGKTNLTIALNEDTQAIEDVIVVAYGTAKKEAFTGSAGVIKSSELEDRQASNVTQSLSGRVAGLQVASANGQPGSSASLRIRGIGSFSAASEPLFVVDGSPYDGNLSNINPADIESMTVLKDAASNALYGSRGANGVVIITTKKGSKSKDAVVTFDMKIGVNTRSKYADYDVIKDPATYYETAFSAWKNWGASDPVAETYLLDNGYFGQGLGYNVYTLPDGESLFVDGKINPNATLGRVDRNYYTGTLNTLLPDDWADAAYKTGVRQDYNVSISGSTDRSDNYFSFGYTNDDGYVVGSSFERYTARVRSDFQAKKWLKVGANAAYTRTAQEGVNTDASSSANIFLLTNMIAPIYPLYVRDEEGNIMHDDYGNTLYDYGNYDMGNYYKGPANFPIIGGSRPFMGQSNPISDNILNENSSVGNALNATGYVKVDFLKDFSFTFNASTDVADSRSTDYTNPYFGQYAGSNGMLTKTHTRSVSVNLQQLLNYSKTFGENTVNVLLGHENYKRKYEYLSGSKVNMFDYGVRELSTAVRNPSANSYDTNYNTEGYFVSADYSYASKYFASAAYRRDASSRFHPDHRWGNFWSVGAAWVLSRENFLNKVSWIDLLKLKASYGAQGNDGIGSYSYVDTYEVVNSAGQPAASFVAKGNPNITWETNYNFNVGAEFSFWQGRLSGSVEYFSRKTEDLLFSRPVPSTLGYDSYPDNIGSMRNRGVEIDLNAVLYRNKNINWSFYVNATHYKNTVISLPPEKANGYATGNYYWSEGGSRYDWYIPSYAGVDQETGMALWYRDVRDAEGNITRTTTDTYSYATKYNHGSALPDLYGGFGTSFECYGFDFSIGFSYQIGGQSIDSGYQALMHNYSSNRGYNWHKDMLNAWTPENPNSNIPMLCYGTNYGYVNSLSDRFLEDASYISLNNISVGYTLPKKWTSKIGLQKLRIYFAADNVAFWSKRKGFDPRQSWDGSTSAQIYAPIRTLSGGLTLQF